MLDKSFYVELQLLTKMWDANLTDGSKYKKFGLKKYIIKVKQVKKFVFSLHSELQPFEYLMSPCCQPLSPLLCSLHCSTEKEVEDDEEDAGKEVDEEDPEPKEEHEVGVHGEGLHPRREVDHTDVDHGSRTPWKLWGLNYFVHCILCVCFCLDPVVLSCFVRKLVENFKFY